VNIGAYTVRSADVARRLSRAVSEAGESESNNRQANEQKQNFPHQETSELFKYETKSGSNW